MTNHETALRDLISRMRSADVRWQVPPAGAVVLADHVDAWADELEALLATPPASVPAEPSVCVCTEFAVYSASPDGPELCCYCNRPANTERCETCLKPLSLTPEAT